MTICCGPPFKNLLWRDCRGRRRTVQGFPSADKIEVVDGLYAAAKRTFVVQGDFPIGVGETLESEGKVYHLFESVRVGCGCDTIVKGIHYVFNQCGFSSLVDLYRLGHTYGCDGASVPSLVEANVEAVIRPHQQDPLVQHDSRQWEETVRIYVDPDVLKRLPVDSDTRFRSQTEPEKSYKTKSIRDENVIVRPPYVEAEETPWSYAS